MFHQEYSEPTKTEMRKLSIKFNSPKMLRRYICEHQKSTKWRARRVKQYGMSKKLKMPKLRIQYPKSVLSEVKALTLQHAANLESDWIKFVGAANRPMPGIFTLGEMAKEATMNLTAFKIRTQPTDYVYVDTERPINMNRLKEMFDKYVQKKPLVNIDS